MLKQDIRRFFLSTPKQFYKATFAFFFAVSFAVVVHAQSPHQVTVVVPFSAGSAQDMIARLIGERLGQELRKPIVIINKPGAGGTVGATFVANAMPDGFTYLLASSSHHLAGALYPRLTYQPLDSFRGAAFWGQSEYVLVASDGMKVIDLASFVRRVQSQPDHFYYASAGNGSVTHIGMASFLNRAGLSMTHVPLKGTGEIISEILAGRIHAAMVSRFSVQAYRSDPRLKLLATTGRLRLEYDSYLPTVSESGYSNFKWSSWVGLLAPVATPVEKIQEMNQAVGKVLNEPAIKDRLNQLGVSSNSLTSVQFDALLKDEWFRASHVITQSKIIAD